MSTNTYQLPKLCSRQLQSMDHLTTEDKICILKYIESGRAEITTKEELEKYAIGSPISYLNKKRVLRQNGYLYKFGPNWFVYITPDFTKKVRVKYANIDKIWVGDAFKTKNDVVSLTASEPETRFPIMIGEHVIRYESSKFKAMRYVTSKKYVTMLKWYEFFMAK